MSPWFLYTSYITAQSETVKQKEEIFSPETVCSVSGGEFCSFPAAEELPGEQRSRIIFPRHFRNGTSERKEFSVKSEIILDNYGAGKSIEYKIYSNLNYCRGQYISSLYVTLPSYNPYYKDELCKGLENYTLCRRWAKVDLTYDEFKKQMKDYYNKIKGEM